MANLYEMMVLPHLDKVKEWAGNGVTQEDIAKNLGISYASFRNYKKQHLELEGALMEAKLIADLKVEGALFKKATGYDYKEVVKNKKKETLGDGKVREYEEARTTLRHEPPDVKAIIFYLTNRKQEEWKNTQNLNAEINTDIKLENLLE